MKVHVRKGDTVRVLTGEDVGKTGKILEVRPKEFRVIVEGVNIVKRHTRPSRTNPQGGVIERPGPVHASNVQLVCPNCDKATRVKRERASGDVTRVCKRCGKPID